MTNFGVVGLSFRISWFTSGRLDLSSTGPTATVTFTWEGDGTEVSGAQFWFNQACRTIAGNRIVYYTDGKCIVLLSESFWHSSVELAFILNLH